MDVKLEYKLATRPQIYHTFLRFFEKRFISANDNPRPAAAPSFVKEAPILTEEETLALADKFADAIPETTFSLAQVQGFLLTKKTDPIGVVEGVTAWVEGELEEKRKLEELKNKKRKKRLEREAQRAKEAAEEEARAKAEAEAEDAEKPAANGTTADEGEQDGEAEVTSKPLVNGKDSEASESFTNVEEVAN